MSAEFSMCPCLGSGKVKRKNYSMTDYVDGQRHNLVLGYYVTPRGEGQVLAGM